MIVDVGCHLVTSGQRFTTEVNYFYRLSDADFDYRAWP